MKNGGKLVTIALALAECNLNMAVLLRLRQAYDIVNVRHCRSHSRCLREAKLLLQPVRDPGLILLLVDRETGKPQEACSTVSSARPGAAARAAARRAWRATSVGAGCSW